MMQREPNQRPHRSASPAMKRPWTSWVCVWWLLLLVGGPMLPVARAAVDAGINQTVWKLLHGVSDAQVASPAWLASDDDGDGLTNGAEIEAATNPFKAGSALAVSSTTTDGTTISLTFPTVLSKLYVLQSTADLTLPGGGWTALNPGVQVVGDGTARTLSAPQGSGPGTFFRVLVQDVDTDNDGVSDWAEKVVGYDPNNARSRGAAQDDRTALTAALALENVVTLTATEATATQPPDGATAASDTGTFTVSRGGTLNFTPLTVPLTWTGTATANVDYAPLPGSVTFPVNVNTLTLTAVPLANPNRLTGAVVTGVAQPGAGYRVGTGSASVAIAPAGNATGSGLTGTYFQRSSSSNVGTYNASLFAGTPTLTRVDPTVNFNWGSTPPGAGLNLTYYAARWEGQVQPEYSGTYYFVTKTDDGVKLWVNGQLLVDGWSYTSGERVGRIALRAGVRYDLKMEYYQGTGGAQAILYWYSADQVKQVIPTARLYPKEGTQAPPAITSPGQAVGFVNQPFSFTVTASVIGGVAPTFLRGPDSAPLPPGLTLNTSTGVISGTPTVAGAFPVSVIASVPSQGTGAAVLDIQILPAGSGVTRERWDNVSAGPRVADIPVTTTPASTDHSLVTLEDTTAHPDNTGVRLRGYFTAPTTGNYYFWLAAKGNAEFWLSDDAEPINKIRRATVAAPGTSPRTWNTANRSPWLSLAAGQRLYYEVLHHTGTGGGSHLAVGYFLDPTGTTTGPTVNVVPGYILSRYDFPIAVASPGTLYVTNLSPQGTATTSASGNANLRLNPANTQAILHFKYSGLTSPRTAYHVHIAPDGNADGNGPIVFDIDDADTFRPEQRTADGGYIWDIQPVGGFSAPQIVTALREGRLYLNVHTVTYPNGEIRGNFGRVQGSQNPPTPVADPGFTDDSNTVAGASRFLNQAAFGAHPTDLASVRANGYSAWLNAQFALTPTRLLPDVMARYSLDPMNVRDSYLAINAWWRAAVTAPDQLRQRVAFALSEIIVVSDSNATLADHGEGMASYYDALINNSFGNFRDLLRAVTLHPTMGYWLNMQGNPKGDLATGLHPNENYAREILQLFSVGLNRLWPDGTLVLNSQGNLVPTYGQPEIDGFSRVFTGWTWNQALQGNGRLPTGFYPSANYVDPMVLVAVRHELGPKLLLNRVVLPGATGYAIATSPVAGSQADPSTVAFDNYCAADLEKALDSIVAHPNVGPYICRQLIQRLVHSNPSPAYLHRVVRVWDDDGSAQHVRGNLRAVVRAILLDGEARNLALVNANPSAGKQREPVMRIAAPARTFPFTANSGTYAQTGGPRMTVTTTNPHRLTVGDTLFLDFTGNATGTPPVEPVTNPTSAAYTVQTTPGANTFTVNATALAAYAWSQPAGSTTLSVNVGTTAANLPPVGTKVRLDFRSLAGSTGTFTVTGTSTTSGVYYFNVTTTDTPTSARGGTANIIPNPWTQAANSRNLVVNVGTAFADRPVVGAKLHLAFGSGSPVTSKEYTVTAVSSAGGTYFYTVQTDDTPTAARSGTLGGLDYVLLPRLGGSYVINGPTGAKVLTFVFYGNHNLKVGDKFWTYVPPNDSTQVDSAEWTVSAVVDENRVTVATPASATANETGRSVTHFPLAAPPLTRNGSFAQESSRFEVRNTNATLTQTPMNAPTVFNFFYPDYQHPGDLAANNVTTPEFQLTTDTNIVNLTNTINSTVLSSGNTKGLSSFTGGNNAYGGAILLDFGAYMTAPYATFNTVNNTNGNTVTAVTTTTVNATLLVNDLADRLTGGTITQAAKDAIVAFLNGSTGGTLNFSVNQNGTATGTVSPPVDPTPAALPTTSARDKARAAVQLILSSPEYAVQR